MISGEELESIIDAESPWVATADASGIAPGIPGSLAQSLAQRIATSTRETPHILIAGPRRVGKTVLLHHIIQRLAEEPVVSARRVFYLSLDKPPLDKLSVIETVEALTDHFGASEDDPLFLFLDEIASSKEWDKRLKNLYDSRRIYHVRITATSSSALEMERAPSQEIGRWDQIYLLPRMFHEYISGRAVPAFILPADSLRERLLRIPDGYSSERADIERLDDYMIRGGLYWDESESTTTAMIQAQVSKMVTKIVRQDIATSAGIRDPITLNDMVYRLAERPGGLTVFSNLGKNLHIATDTVKSYLSHLEESLLIFRLRNCAGGQIRKPPKVYFWDVAVPAAVRFRTERKMREPANRSLGLENIAASVLQNIALQSAAGVQVCHWRTDKKQEVDLIYREGDEPPMAFEIASETNHSLKGLRKLIEVNPEFAGNSYLVAPECRTGHQAHEDGIGRLPLVEFLKAAGHHAEYRASLRERSPIPGSRKES